MMTILKTDQYKGVFSLFVYPNILRKQRYGVIGSVLLGTLLCGCASDQPREKEDTKYYTDESSAVFAPDIQSEGGNSSRGSVWDRALAEPRTDSSKSTEPAYRGGWSIMLANVGEGGMERAKKMLQIVQSEAGLTTAFIDTRATGIVIAYGDYLGKEDPRAIEDLNKVHNIDLMGVKIFENATMVPPSSSALRGSNPAYDLRTVKDRFGEMAVYTLQIGLYGRSDYQMPSGEDLAEFRKSAENAVRELRDQGVMAFYYHAPSRSMVTVGVFGERDFDSTTLPPMQSRALLAMREQFPNNLLNGQGINETVNTESGRVTRLQSSQLVGIPKK